MLDESMQEILLFKSETITRGADKKKECFMLFLAKRVKKKNRGKVDRTQRGYSLTGKTAILHIVILGSSPNISRFYTYIYFFFRTFFL